MDKNETTFQFFQLKFFNYWKGIVYLTIVGKSKTKKPHLVVPTQETHRIIPISFPYIVDATFPCAKLETMFRLPRTAKLNPVDQQNHNIYFPFTTLHFYKRGYSYIFRFKKLWNFLIEHVCYIFSTTVPGCCLHVLAAYYTL